MPALLDRAPAVSEALISGRRAATGMAFVAAYAACTAAMSMMIKSADAGFSVWQIGFLRSAVGLVPLAAILARRGEPFGSAGWRMLCLRGLWGLAAMVCYFAALRRIPLADAAVLNFCAPAFTAGLAALVLGEKLEARAAAWLGLASAGLWLGLKPSWSGSAAGYAVGLGAGLFSAAAFVTVKAMAGRESPWRIVLYFNAVAAACLLALLRRLARADPGPGGLARRHFFDWHGGPSLPYAWLRAGEGLHGLHGHLARLRLLGGRRLDFLGGGPGRAQARGYGGRRRGRRGGGRRGETRACRRMPGGGKN